jgi:hypothetical protein
MIITETFGGKMKKQNDNVKIVDDIDEFMKLLMEPVPKERKKP